MTTWKLFIVTHRGLVEDWLRCDPSFDSKFYVEVNVRFSNSPTMDVPVIQMCELPGYVPLGSHWAESEAIYAIWRSGLHKSLEWVGFTQWDKPLRLTKGPRRRGFTQTLEDQLRNSSEKAHFSLETHNFRKEARQRILADFNQPSKQTGKGVSAYQKILDDFNEFYGTRMTILDLRLAKKINLVSSFVIHSGKFEEMMTFFDWVVRTRNLDKLDPERKFRAQGGLAERYFGVWLALRLELVDLTTPHLKPALF